MNAFTFSGGNFVRRTLSPSEKVFFGVFFKESIFFPLTDRQEVTKMSHFLNLTEKLQSISSLQN